MKRVSFIIGLGVVILTIFFNTPAWGFGLGSPPSGPSLVRPIGPEPAPSGGSCAAAPSGIVGWWPGEGNANDIIGGDNGTLSPSGATYVPGEVGLGFRLDGTNGYVQIPDSAALRPTNVTVEAWVWLDPNVNTNYASGEYIIFKRNTWTYLYEGYALAQYQGYFQFLVTSQGNQVIATSTTPAQRGVWFHVAGTYDGNTLTIYVNGVAEGTAVAGFALNYDTLPVYLGTSGQPAPYQGMLAGIIDEASIYNRALAANEIAAVYNAGSAGKCKPNESACVPPPSGIVGWWAAESNAVDSIAGNNGTLMNGTGYASGEVGTAFSFNGVNNFVLVNPSSPENLDVGAGTGLTIEGWINPTTLSAPMPIAIYEQALGTANGSDVGTHFYVGINPPTGTGSGCLVANLADTNGFSSHIITTSPNVVTAGVWQHVALTYDKASGMSTIYLNGNVVTQENLGTFTPQTTFTNLLIGGHTTYGSVASPSEKFYGGLDEISLYNRALTANEVAAIFNAGSAGKCKPGETACVPPPSGIVGWWPGAGNAVDSIAANNGTLMNGTTFTNGEVGQAFYLDGINNYVLANPASPANLDVGAGAGFTLEGWINPTTTSVSMPLFEYERTLGSQNAADIGSLAYFNLQPSSGNGNGSVTVDWIDTTQTSHILNSPGNIMTAGVWQHVAVTYDKASGQAAIYLNGTSVAQADLGTFTPQTSFTNLLLGARTYYGSASSPSDKFSGGLDEISLYNRALSSNEVAAIYNAGSAGKCGATSLLPYIITPPASTSLIEGGQANLSVIAGGTGTLSYQWLFNGKKITGAISDALSLTNIHPNQAGKYAVKVTDPSGSVTSSPAVLTVITQPVLIYGYNGSEKITTLGSEMTYSYSGEMLFIPATTNAIFVGWANIGGKKQYWVSQDPDYLWITVAGSAGRSYTVLGRAGSGVDVNGAPHLWSDLHEGQNANLPIATRKTFSFPNTMSFSQTQAYPDEQTGNMVLRVAASNYSFLPGNTQAVNNNGQTVNDVVSALVASLTKQGYKPQ